MTELSHDLAEEFAGKAEVIHDLKLSNAHFRRLLEENHVLYKEIQSIQTGVAPASDEALEGLEKKRLTLLDEIASMISEAEAATA